MMTRQMMNMTETLVNLLEQDELFLVAPQNEAHITFSNGQRMVTCPVRSDEVKAYMLRKYQDACEGTLPTMKAVKEAVDTLELKALGAGIRREVFLRTAQLADGRIVIDLGTPTGEAVVVGPDGWEIVPVAPVRFVRKQTTTAFPMPLPNGDINLLRPYINVADDDSFRLAITPIVSAHIPSGPQPILNLVGEPGTSKSTVSRIARSLVDPSTSPVKAFPRGTRNLLIDAANNAMLVYDNLSSLTNDQSDDLCGLSTRRGFSIRILYKNCEQMTLDISRFVILNGIGNIVIRGDLASRVVSVELPRIAGIQRRTEADLWRDYMKDYPSIFGGLLTALSGMLREMDSVRLTNVPRMADFAQKGVALEKALGWPEGSFLSALERTALDRQADRADDDYSIIGIRKFMEDKPQGWKGTMSQLLDELHKVVPPHAQRHLPPVPNALATRIGMEGDVLRTFGIEVDKSRTGSERRITLRWITNGEQDLQQDTTTEVTFEPTKVEAA